MKDLSYQRFGEVTRKVSTKNKLSIVGDWVATIIAWWAVVTISLAIVGVVLGDK
jgi:hypothetical protein